MCRGAASGAIDFERADPRDRRWWRKLAILADQIEEEGLSAVRRLNHRVAAALLSRGDLTDESLGRVREHAEALAAGIKRQLFPWADLDESSAARTAIADMRRQWVASWGDPDDPATAARIDATAAALERQLAATTAPAAAAARPPRAARRMRP